MKAFFKYMEYNLTIVEDSEKTFSNIKFCQSSKCVTDFSKIDLETWDICKEKNAF